MNDAMAHGGPDGEGVYINEDLGVALGHRRLSIIDLSEQANQPMFNSQQTLAIVFNGEIYNYQALKAELQKTGATFKTNSDTEVILQGYHVWGIDTLLKKLKGMFAFVLLDVIQKKIIAARDHAGIKPLYLAKKGGDYYFTSEIRALLNVDPGWQQNQSWRTLFLTFGFIPEPLTMLENVSAIEKGSYCVISLLDKGIKYNKFYTPQYSQTIIPYEEAVSITKELVNQSVQRHLVSDVPVGVFLSGGVDSSILTVLAQQANKSPIQTLSIYFDDEKYSENKFQQIIAKKTGVNHKHFKVTYDEFIQTWPQIYSSFDQPSVDAINTHFICKYAQSQGLKVVLSGLGADEYFGGYPSFNRSEKFNSYARFAALQELFPTKLLSYPTKKIEYLNNNLNNAEYLLYRGLFTPKDVSKILDVSLKEVIQTINKVEQPSFLQTLSNKNRASYYESSIYMLSQLLKDSDVQSMWHGVELRVPFLDKAIIDFANSLHTSIKYKDGRQKPLLIDSFKEELPKEVWNRPKQGFTFPFENWFLKIPAFQNSNFVPSSYYKKFNRGAINFSRLWGVFLARTYGSIDNISGLKAQEKPKFLFTYLMAFKHSGGIEKVNKAILKSISDDKSSFVESWGLHDSFVDSRYFPRFGFRGFQGNKINYIIALIKNYNKWEHILVGHINLALPIFLIKQLNPKLKITLIAHGIDVWSKQKGMKQWLLQHANQILSVSNYTKQQLVEVNQVIENKIVVVPNCLDVFFEPHVTQEKPAYLVRKHKLQITNNTKIVLTLSRLKSTEKYKGYDNVIEVLGKIKAENTCEFIYLLCGSYDKQEFERVNQLVKNNNLQQQVIVTGFVPDDELADYYQLADIFIMPSKKEGFGIVFIEAAASGTEVIAGNSDGSAEALQFGKLGTLVNPDNNAEIYKALKASLLKPSNYAPDVAEMAYAKYNFQQYCNNLNKILFA